MTATGGANRERSFARLITFIDAVVAIAITLLGLPLIDIANQLVQTGDVGTLLANNWTHLLAFLLSFTVIARFWIGHHRMYDQMIDYDAGLIWANMLWLVTIVFLPFPTELVAVSGDYEDWGVTVLYIGTMIASSLAMMLQVAIVRRNPRLMVEGATMSYAPTVSTAVSLTIAMLIGIAFPVLNLWALIIVLPARWISDAIEKRHERTRPTTA